MALAIHPITEPWARAITAWRYPAPYDIYDHEPDDLHRLLLPTYRYHAVLDAGDLVGYCCFGDDACVPGGTYPPDALAVGAGMRPDLTGRGHGRRFLAAILDFGRATSAARTLSATVAAFNDRALALCLSLGFVEASRFTSTGDDPREFVMLLQQASPQ
jgi:[ribosomal protein S18]-alanine N-acetyltransferase